MSALNCSLRTPSDLIGCLFKRPFEDLQKFQKISVATSAPVLVHLYPLNDWVFPALNTFVPAQKCRINGDCLVFGFAFSGGNGRYVRNLKNQMYSLFPVVLPSGPQVSSNGSFCDFETEILNFGKKNACGK